MGLVSLKRRFHFLLEPAEGFKKCEITVDGLRVLEGEKKTENTRGGA